MDELPMVTLRDVVVPELGGSISFDLAGGDCVALIDEDDVRRTALLKVIAGLRPPTLGTVQAPAAAAVWHDDGMPDDEPVIDTVRAVLAALGSSVDPHELLAGIGLAHRAGHEPWAMSLGERRRIAIEVACRSGAPVVVLDEPERGLDATARRWLQRRVRAVQAEGRVVVMATHDAALAEACGDFVVDDLDTLTG
jgi:ABC-type nitrate/sulfonate/bicarbonate transport system ATPase subunit